MLPSIVALHTYNSYIASNKQFPKKVKMQNDLIKQAIADAKALRQSAYELAKEQIAETFGPRVQEMIKLKLSEMDDESLAFEAKDKEEKPVDEAKHDEEEKAMGEAKHDKKDAKMEAKHDEDPMKEGDDMGEVDEVTLDELLAELEAEDDSKKLQKEGDDDDADDKEEKEDDEAGESEEGPVEGGEEVTELTVDELKDIIRDVLSDIQMGGAPADDAGALEPEAGAGEEAGGEGEVDLAAEVHDDSVDEITLDEILASLEEADKEEDPKMEAKHGEEEKAMEEVKKMKHDLQEAVKTINTLRTELNEVNLLNAKLLYVNKIFKAKSLSEAQKLKVINAFDRAENVKEAKKIYETLQDSIATTNVAKKSIKESVGFASKPAGMVAKTQPIVEQNDIVNRWQVLAGIKKTK